MIDQAFPQWVLVDGQLHRVSEYQNIKSHLRPESFCPVCKTAVIMKLGNERVHHYAHKTDIECALTKPETALHLNTKFYIYNQLLLGNQLFLEEKCAECGKSRIITWTQGWKRVEVEYGISQYRPDIAIIDYGENISAAIEVKVTHEVEDTKIDFYQSQNIAWLELEANESIYEGENTWNISQPLPFVIFQSQSHQWICDVCLDKLRQEEELRKKAQQEWEWRLHNHEDTVYTKLVDFYYPSGSKYREQYFIKQVIRDDKPISVTIHEEKGKIIWKQNGEINNEMLSLISEIIQGEIDKRKKYGAIIDEREMVAWIRGLKFVARDTWRNPYKYQWDANKKKWE